MNRLSRERSPYLRQHQDNPVDWYPWGKEALDRARAEDKPILLSVGYSACHWCHVMAHESFEDPSTADQMNAHFINVKVDREERPDLDALYQGVVQLMGKGGGWPLTVFLKPDLTPFFGGTYFPPDARYGMPSFKTLLTALADAWRNRRSEIDDQAQRLLEGLQQLASYGLSDSTETVTGQDVVAAGRKLADQIDRVFGGFLGAPKFPNPMNLSLLFRAYRRTKDESLLSAALLTLERMARGGIYDQLGGGFHRYSVDARWQVPHFEKMLYDNAQLLHLYAEAEQLAPRPLWNKVAKETVGWLFTEMTSSKGGFFSTQDADTEGEEGKYFVWREAEVEALLPAEDAALLKRHLGISSHGNFEGSTVLSLADPAEELAKSLGRSLPEVEQALERGRATLLAARKKRTAPGRDDKILTGWNGLMIRGLAFAARVFQEPAWSAAAERAAQFLLQKMWDGDRLLRSYQDGRADIQGCLEDYGHLCAGLTALYQATFSPRWLEAAESIDQAARNHFWDKERKAYWTAAKGTEDLRIPTYALFDQAIPSGASTLTEAQVTLAALNGRPEALQHPGQYLAAQRANMADNPAAFGHLLLAADAFADGAPSLVVAGSSERVKPLLEVLSRTYAPTLASARIDGVVPSVLAGTAAGKENPSGAPTAYLCHHFSCEPPITSPEVLEERLARL